MIQQEVRNPEGVYDVLPQNHDGLLCGLSTLMSISALTGRGPEILPILVLILGTYVNFLSILK